MQRLGKLLGLKVSDFVKDGSNVVKEDFFITKDPGKETSETLDLRFDDERQELAGAAEPEIGPVTPESIAQKTGLTLDSSVIITIVDDDPIIRELVKVAFSKVGCSVKAYENGRAFVLDMGKNRPDLVFLDLLMPEMDGFSVLKIMRAKKIKTPVIILSALSQKETIIKALNLGVSSYMTKPLKPENILRKTAEILKIGL